MTKEEFLTRMEQLYAENMQIARDKNDDYANVDDPFHNFRAAELYGVDTAQAILVRMSDKMARIGNLLDKETVVKNESIYDSCSDLANYAMILRVWLEDKVSKI